MKVIKYQGYWVRGTQTFFLFFASYCVELCILSINLLFLLKIRVILEWKKLEQHFSCSHHKNCLTEILTITTGNCLNTKNKYGNNIQGNLLTVRELWGVFESGQALKHPRR